MTTETGPLPVHSADCLGACEGGQETFTPRSSHQSSSPTLPLLRLVKGTECSEQQGQTSIQKNEQGKEDDKCEAKAKEILNSYSYQPAHTAMMETESIDRDIDQINDGISANTEEGMHSEDIQTFTVIETKEHEQLENGEVEVMEHRPSFYGWDYKLTTTDPLPCLAKSHADEFKNSRCLKGCKW